MTALLLATACSQSKPIAAPTSAANASVSPSSAGKADRSTIRPSASASPTLKSGGRATPGTGPSPAWIPFTPDPTLPVTATLSPRCARVGGTETLTVRTEPRAVVAYIAVYSNNRSGAGKGFGAGYGGNNGGEANSNGEYRDTWTLAANTPPGPARVDVYVTSREDGSQRYVNVLFEVADASGRCN